MKKQLLMMGLGLITAGLTHAQTDTLLYEKL